MMSVLSFFLSGKNAGSDHPGRFVRGVMGGTFLKFLLCIVAAVVYVFINKKEVHIPDLIMMMVLYIIYTVIETAFLMKLSRSK